MTITFPWPPKVLSPNARPHWATKAEAARKYREDCRLAGWNSRKEIVGKTRFKITFCPPTRHRFDGDNLISRFKAGQDALSQIALEDDSKFEITYSRGPVTKNGAVLVEVLG